MLNMGRKKRRMGRLYIPEPLLLSRLNKYLESKSNEETIDQHLMVEDLRTQYKEYEKRDKVGFRASVFRAYNYLLEPLINPNSMAQTGHTPASYSSPEEEESDHDEIQEISVSSPVEKEVTITDNEKTCQVNDKEKNNGNVPYMQGLQKMVNSVKGCHAPSDPAVVCAIDISSDEDDQPPASKQNVAELMVINSKPIPQLPSGVSVSRISKNTPVSNMKRRPGVHLMPEPKRRREFPPRLIPLFNFSFFGGSPKVIKTLKESLAYMKHPEVYKKLGLSTSRGFLLHGPPGTGKTLLASCIAGELGLRLFKVSGPELISGISGESEQRIRFMFEEAMDMAPSVLFIDEIDAISSPRDSASKEMERRVVAQLLTSMDLLNETPCDVIVVGATSRPDALDPGLRRAGRFDRELCLGMPDYEGRLAILKIVTSKLKLADSVSLDQFASVTPGYVGADLAALANCAANFAVSRYLSSLNETENLEEKNKTIEPTGDSEATAIQVNSEKSETTLEDDKEESLPTKVESSQDLDSLCIEFSDFEKALASIQPSAKREGFATVPDVTWSDVGSLVDVRQQLEMSILMPVKYPEDFSLMGITSCAGVLLCGPPGCGKTLLAKAVANEANINFISVKGPELLNMYVGESERAVRQVFQRARNSQPCVIFFDEIDALCPKRSDFNEGSAGGRVVNQLLTEMDGVEGGRKGVSLMAATNRPDMVDPAVLRPGRFDKVIYIGLPKAHDRTLILHAITKGGTKPPLSSDVDLAVLAESEACEGYTGADLAALIKEAALLALTEYINNGRQGTLEVNRLHLEQAVRKIRPSVSEKEQRRYEEYRLLFGPRTFEEKMEESE